MPGAEFFIPLGLFIRRDALGPGLCSRIVADLRQSPAEPAVVGDSYSFHVDETVRKTLRAQPSPESIAAVKQHLLAQKDPIETHFRTSLSGCEDPQFLVYRKGDFFREHEDALSGHGLPPRKVSIVLFINDDYRGGALTFYGLVEDPRWKNFGFPLVAEPGLMVAFRPEVRHEVTAVTEGVRYTIASWFY